MSGPNPAQPNLTRLTSQWGPDEVDDDAIQAGCDEPGEMDDYGLALSGGGYRAMLFHLGALWRLNEMGLLGRIGRFSGVSGGSFATALLALAWPHLEFENGKAKNFDKWVRDPIVRLSRSRVDVWVIAAGVVPPLRATHIFARWLDWRFFHGTRLDQLPDHPIFIFNAMHFATGVGWRFRKRYMGTYRVGLICAPHVPLSTAVAASAAFPPFMGSYKLRTDPNAYIRTDGADLWDDPEFGHDLRSQALLFDGGAYDNLAIQPLLKRCRTILVSDAGGNLKVDKRTWRYRLWGIQTKRILDAAVDQGRDLRRAALMQGKKAGDYELGIWRTLSDPARFRVPEVVPVSRDWRNYLASIKTRMWPPSDSEREALVAWGYLASDLALRAYIKKDAAVPTRDQVPYHFDFSKAPPKKRPAAGASALKNANA